ncbi:restriction endonuclease [Haloarchaeobius salinus]|uniref:restriction endonuclease n=1 Tax=Haloarchaeobius salinus TaxID=1198298 RepID=UPI00210ED748|nr:restriction endonuclease [Haloarchaeobius salinus]
MNLGGLSETNLSDLLQSMDPYKFEKLVAELWGELGYTATVTSGSGDRGIDIEARKEDPFHRLQLIQVKRHSDANRIGSSIVRNYSTLYSQRDDADIVAIVTTGQFTSDAIHLAEDLGVRTMAGDKLCELLIQEIGVENLIDRLEIETETGSEGTPDSTIRNPADCFYCDRSFQDDSARQDHIRDVHDGGIDDSEDKETWEEKVASGHKITCPECQALFNDEAGLEKHLNKDHTTKGEEYLEYEERQFEEYRR